MGIIKDVLGLALIMIAWINPLGLDIKIAALIFILGFELMSMLPRVGSLVISIFFFETLGVLLSLILVVLFVVDIVLKTVIKGAIFGIVFKPILLAVVSFIVSSAPLPSALMGIASLIIFVVGLKFKI